MENTAPIGEAGPGGLRSQAGAQTLLVGLIVFLFFAWGFATVLNDILIPKLKGLFALSYAQVLLTQFCFFSSYLLFSIPAGLVLSRIGYVRGVVLGLGIMATGCFLFFPASLFGSFSPFLVPLFVMAAGITMLQVAANPFIELLGSAETSHFRLTLAQAFNSLATFVGPIVGSALILGGTTGLSCERVAPVATSLSNAQSVAQIAPLYLAMATVLGLLAVVFWLLRNRPAPAVPGQAQLSAIPALLGQPRLAFGAMAIFIYVGAEVSIGSVMANYLTQPSVLHLSTACAGRYVSLYWGGAMVGRFIGAGILFLRAKPGHVLALCAIGAMTLVTASSLSTSAFAGYALIAVGLFNSIMFPTIFSLASEGLGDQTPNGAGLLGTAIVGGAIVPLITGAVADATSLATALLVPAVCYIGIAIYGVSAARGLGLASEAVAVTRV